MKPFTAELVPVEIYELFIEISQVLENLPDNPDVGNTASGNPFRVNPHVVTRAFSLVYKIPHVTGKYAGQNHTWLVFEDGKWIIDLMPFGTVGGPLLVLADGPVSPGVLLYHSQERHRLQFAVCRDASQNAVSRLVALIRAEKKRFIRLSVSKQSL